MMLQAFYNVLWVTALSLIGIFLGLLFKGIDRVLAARMQARVGPPITQAFTDTKKLLMKENIIPRNAVKWVFELMPVLALVSALLILPYLPLFDSPALLMGYGDLILVLYLLAVPSLALALGGFASASPYATIGAQREIVTMLSYEFPLAIVVVSLGWLVSMTQIIPMAGVGKAFSLGAISLINVWALVGPIGSIGLFIMLVVLLLVMPAELSKIPFDAAEAETEIGGGMLAEYSGRNLALFYVADGVKAFAMASLIVAIFLPWSAYQVFGLTGWIGALAQTLFFLLKVLAVMFFGSTFLRVALPRLRITQVVSFYWGYASLAAAVGLLLVAIDLVIF